MSTPWYGMYPREAEEELKERYRYTIRGPRKPSKHLVRSKEREEADTGGNDLEFSFEARLDCESNRQYDTPGIDTLLESYTLESDFRPDTRRTHRLKLTSTQENGSHTVLKFDEKEIRDTNANVAVRNWNGTKSPSPSGRRKSC